MSWWSRKSAVDLGLNVDLTAFYLKSRSFYLNSGITKRVTSEINLNFSGFLRSHHSSRPHVLQIVEVFGMANV